MTDHAHATAAAFATVNASKNAILPWRLKTPDSSPAKAYAMVKNGVPPAVRSIAMPNAAPMVQPVIMPQRSVQVMMSSSAISLPSDSAPNISICESAISSTATVITILLPCRSSSDSVVRSVSSIASRRNRQPPKENTVSSKMTAAAGA